MASGGAQMLTVATQAPHVRNYGEGLKAPGPGLTLVVAADNGLLEEFFVDVLGWWQ
jgi:hypothetical protein